MFRILLYFLCVQIIAEILCKVSFAVLATEYIVLRSSTAKSKSTLCVCMKYLKMYVSVR